LIVERAKRKDMKKILSLTLLLSGLTLATFAQQDGKANDSSVKKERRLPKKERHMERKSPEEIAKVRTEHLDKQLKFTEAQRNEVYALQLAQAKRHEAHRSEMKKLQEKWKAEAKESHDKFQQTLTPEQQQLMKEKFANAKNKKMLRKREDYRGKEGFRGRKPMIKEDKSEL